MLWQANKFERVASEQRSSAVASDFQSSACSLVLFGKDMENSTKKPSAIPKIWVPRVWVLTLVKSFT